MEMADDQSSSSDEEIIDKETESSYKGEAESDDEDEELQIAFREGLLQKNGLNLICDKKRPFINKMDEMEKKYAQLHKKSTWLDSLHIKFPPELAFKDSVNKDFDREAAFYKQAQAAAKIAISRLASLKVPVFRPSDYFAEMAKSDRQMQRVRTRILDIQKTKERQEKAKKLREEKKFAVKVQRATEERKQKDKRKLMEAVKKHRKGMKGQLETMLKNANRMQMDNEDEDDNSFQMNKRGKGKFKMSRTVRDKKYGFGGQKKRSKMNTKKSFNMH